MRGAGLGRRATRGAGERALGDDAGWEGELREAPRIDTAMVAIGWMERIAQELAS